MGLNSDPRIGTRYGLRKYKSIIFVRIVSNQARRKGWIFTNRKQGPNYQHWVCHHALTQTKGVPLLSRETERKQLTFFSYNISYISFIYFVIKIKRYIDKEIKIHTIYL